MAKIKDFDVIDLFCGIGGLTQGFIQEGFSVSAGVDFDDTCKYAYEKNNKAKFIYQDITNVSGEDLQKNYRNGKRKILIGCAPCQPFSIYNHKNNNNEERQKQDTKWRLLYSFANLIEEIQPEIVSMENVPQLLTFNNGEVFNDFISVFARNGYEVKYQICNAKDYGVPQRRKRLILLASKLGEIEIIPPLFHEGNYKTVRDAIGSLPPIVDGEFCSSDMLHFARKLNPMNKKRIQATPEGGGWRDWDESLILDCHKKENGKEFKSAYGRMKWDDVSPTMTTFCIGLSNGRFGHPEQDRAISLREAALFQSFPESYDFINPNATFSSPTIARQIGNAVPVGLAKAIAHSIKLHISKIDE